MKRLFIQQFCIWIIAYSIIAISSCSVSKRCEHHLAKAKQFGCLSIKNDTIIRLDTIHGFKTDTIVQFSQRTDIDTLYVDKNGVKVQTIIKWRERIVNQEITKKDTVIKTVSINHNTETKVYINKIPWYIYVLIGSLIFLLILSLWHRK